MSMRAKADNHQKSDSHAGRVVALLAFAVIALAIPLTANAAMAPKPGAGPLTIGTSVNPVLYGRSVVISGRLKGKDDVGKIILLRQNPYPFAGYVDVGTAVTVANGNYSFTVVPKLNTRFRVTATTTTPPTTSGELLQTVKPRVSLRLSDSTPARGQKVVFSGFVTPAHDGKLVRIQRRTSTGSFSTIARVRLRDDGDLRSKYSRSIRLYRSGVFRVAFLADLDHAAGTSSTRTARVH